MDNHISFFVLLSLLISSNMLALSLQDSHEAVSHSVSTSSHNQDDKRSLDLELFEALKAGSVEDVKRLLAMGALPDHHSSLRAAPIYYAAYYGHVACVEALLDFGASWDVPNARWFTPHLIAFLERHTKVEELLVARGSELQGDGTHGWTPLHRAAYFKDDERIPKLITQGFLVNALSRRGVTPLHAAAKGGSQKCVDNLIEQKADIMARQKNGSTLLHCAAEGGLLPLIGLCLEKDLDVLEADEEGWQPIHCAARYASSEAVKYLLMNGADGNVKTIHSVAPVHLAAIHGDVQSLQTLVEQGAQIDVLTVKNYTPLHYAAENGSVACAQFCLSKGVDMEAKNYQLHRALEVAAANGSFGVLTTLLERGSAPRNASSSWITGLLFPEGIPLSLKFAVDGGHAECVGALLDAGTVPYPEGPLDGTSIEAAMTYGSYIVLKEFVKRLHRLFDTPTEEKQESCRRAAEFFNSYKQKYVTLTGSIAEEMVENATSCAKTENDFVRAILHMLRESERTVHLEEKEIDPLKTVSKDDMALLLTLDSTREAVKRSSCDVLRGLFREFHEKNTSTMKNCTYESLKRMTDERRSLLDPSQVERKFGETIRQGIDEWITFLENPAKTCKGYMRTRYGYTPLHFAALRSSDQTVKSLVDRGLSVHARTDIGLTPLHLAAIGGKLENMQLIQEAGAPMSVTSNGGTTVLHCAALGGSVSCVKFCLAAGSTCDERTNQGFRALHFASYGGSVPVINFLRSEGALMNEPTDMGSWWIGPSGKIISPLILAIKGGYVDCVEALLRGGTNPLQLDGSPEIPLEYALKYGSEEILHVFMKSMYRCLFPLDAKIEEARSVVHTRFTQLHRSGSTLRVEDVLPLLTGEAIVNYFAITVLSELNTEVQYSSPAFADFSAYELKRLFETPEVLDVVTTYVMKRLKALCKRLRDTDELRKRQADHVGMSAERRALLNSETLEETFRPIIRTEIKKPLAKLTKRLRGSLREESSHEGKSIIGGEKLLEPIKNGLNHEVASLLYEGVSPDEKVAGRVTALAYAVYYGHKECTQTLMNAGADWKSPFLYDFTPHKLAVLKNNVEIVELFSARESRVEPSACSNWNSLHWASLFGDDTLMRELLSQGVSIDCLTDERITPLHLAARGGSQACVDYLIEQGADIMALQNNGLTLLHCAAEGGLTSLVDLCLNKGLAISVSSGDKDWRPIHSAACYGSSKMIDYLLSKGADVNIQTGDGMSPLHLAAACGNIGKMLKLVEWGADFKVSSKSKKSVLHLAAVGGSVDCVTVCFSHGLKQNLIDSEGWRPLDYAADSGSYDVLRLLLSKEPPEVKRFELPLRLVINGNHVECVKPLLEAGANPMIGCLMEKTPFECAMKYGSLGIVETFMLYSYKLFCPTDLEVGTSRIRIDKALNSYKGRTMHQKPLTISDKISFLTQSDVSNELARMILSFLNRNHPDDNDLARIAGLSAEETNSLLKMDETKDLVEQYLVEQVSLLCEKLCNAHEDNTGDVNSQILELNRRELLTRESIQKVFGKKIRQGIEEQFARLLEGQPDHVVPEESEETSSSPDSKGVVVKLECCIF